MFSPDDDLALAHALADTAAAIASRYFQQRSLRAQTKPDGSLVTEADRLIEAAVCQRLRQYRPGDAFTGEELGSYGRSLRRWFIDPIDGTASFMAGRPDWRILIAVEDGGTITMGLVSSPALCRRWWATRGGGAWTRRYDRADAEPARLAVTGTARLERATVALWPVVANLPDRLRAPAARLLANCARSPAHDRKGGPQPVDLATVAGTGHGALMVAAGHIDVFLLAGGGPWDLAAMVPIVEEAGGRFSDVTGERSLDAVAAVFTNGAVHDRVLHCLSQDADA